MAISFPLFPSLDRSTCCNGHAPVSSSHVRLIRRSNLSSEFTSLEVERNYTGGASSVSRTDADQMTLNLELDAIIG